MAIIVSAKASSSTSNSTPPWNYQVFLSFRGEETRKSFCDHLYAALRQRNILTFRDDEELGRGEVISQELERAIEGSLFSIVILSPNYASSTWCLTELQKIIDSTKVLGRKVFPIFYGVDPSDVRHQRGSFAKAFEEYEEKFRHNQKKEMVQKWRDALKEVANISGWNSKDWHEAELVQSIAEAIWIKLRIKFPPYFANLVGIDSKIEEINKLLKMGMDDVPFVGIWGMGGIGKSTIARVIYESIRSEFEISYFLANVRETYERDGLVHLQKQLLSCLNKRDLKIHDEFEGMKMIREVFCNKKVLLILDDVSDGIQIENLAVKQEWFGPGSRVVITTRDMHLLTTQVFQKYEVQTLSNDESLQLLCQKAFNKSRPEEEFLELSNDVVRYAGGLPLALNVLGSFLCKRSVSEWQDTLDKLKQNQQKDILKVLKISYDGLEDEEFKTIFLDIACFFNWENKYKTTQILASCGLHPTIGLKVLLEKALLNEYGEILYMHALLQEMGRNLVLQESPHDPSRRSRLWSVEQIDQVLRGNKGAEDIQGIVLNLKEPYETMWHPDCFSKMCNLRLLAVSNMHRLNGVNSISSALKVLRWERYPLKTLPSNLKLDELVDLEMCHSKMRQLWINGTQVFDKLKFINLSHCDDLIKTPDFAGIPNLESLILESCISIAEVHPSLGQHKKLVKVDLRDCKSLKTLPSKLEMNSLEELILSGCTKVRKLSEFGENMKRLRRLYLEETGIVKLPPSLVFLTSLAVLILRGCKNLTCIPDNFNKNMDLEELDVSGTAISEVPSSICLLKNLKHLNLGGCRGPSSNSWSILNLPFGEMFGSTRIPIPVGLKLPPLLFSKLPLLKTLVLSYCNLRDETIPNDLSCLSSLEFLDLTGNNFINLPADSLSNLLMLKQLWLGCCPNLQSLPQLPPNLTRVNANDCPSMGPSLDPEQLWNLFTSMLFQNCHLHHNNYFGGASHVLLIPGNEIPPWFHNRKFSFVDFPFFNSDISLCNSAISIIIDIRDMCHSSEWSGIAVCLVVQEPMRPPSRFECSISWSFNSPEDAVTGSRGWLLDLKYNEPQSQLFLAFFPFDYDNCWRHLSGGRHQLQLVMYSQTKRSGEKILIKACGWRLLCKEDLQRMSSERNNVGNSTSNSGIHITEIVNDKRCRREFEAQDASPAESFDAQPHRVAQRRKLH